MLTLKWLFGDDAEVLRETDFQLLLLAAMLPVLGTTLLSPMLDSLIDPFGTSTANIGLMISVFTAPGIVMIPIAGVLGDRYGRKPVLVSALLLFGIAGTAIAFTTDFRLVLVLRLLQGIGFGGINPIIITSIGDLYTGAKEATGQGFRFTVTGLAGAFFPIIAGILVVIAWQYPFLLYAVSIPVAGMVYFWFKEPTGPEVVITTDGGTSESYRHALFRLVRQRRVFSLLIARALPPAIFIGFATYNSIIVVRLMGGTPPQAGALFAVFSFVYAVAGSQAGRITALTDSRFMPLVAANICLGCGFAVTLFAEAISIAGVGTAIAGVGLGVLLPLYRSIITGLAPEGLRAGLVSLSEAGGRVTNTVTPIVMGGVIALGTPVIGFAPAIQVAGIVVAVGAGGGGILFLLIARTSPAVETDFASHLGN